MYRRSILNESILLCRSESQECQIPIRICDDSELIICHNLAGLSEGGDELCVAGTHSSLTWYYDDEQDLYITNFDDKEEILEEPIKLISVKKDTVMIYVGCHILKADRKCVHHSVLTEKFYVQNRFDFQEPRRKRTKFFENRPALTSDVSEEHGIFSVLTTNSVESCSSISSILNDPNNKDSYDGETSASVRKINPIIKSKIDTRTQHRIEMGWFKQKLAELFTKYKFPSKDELISPEKLITTKSYASTDIPISKMINELENTLTLGDADPIIVTRSGSSLRVLSGNRRVVAFKTVGLNQIRVSCVEKEQEPEFSLYHFFSTNYKGRSEPLSFEYVSYIRGLFSHLQITPSILKTWTPSELKDVFSVCFDSNSRNYLFLELCLHQELADKIVYSELLRSTISSTCLTEVLRKYRYNPLETLSTISAVSPECKEPEFRKKLSLIQPDARHMLSKKGMNSENIEELMIIFGSDTLFPRFVRGLDLRCSKKTMRVETIAKKFEEFRKKESKMINSSVPDVILLPENSDCDVLITDDKSSFRRFIDANEDAIAILVGQHTSKGSNHTLIFEDRLGFVDEQGVLHNHCSLSLNYKKKGVEMMGRDLSEEFTNIGFVRKTVMSPSDFHVILSSSICIYLESHELSIRKIICQLLHKSKLVAVNDDKVRAEITDTLAYQCKK